jgi:hypothetical protein
LFPSWIALSSTTAAGLLLKTSSLIGVGGSVVNVAGIVGETVTGSSVVMTAGGGVS